jgi:hypothetical protein
MFLKSDAKQKPTHGSRYVDLVAVVQHAAELTAVSATLLHPGLHVLDLPSQKAELPPSHMSSLLHHHCLPWGDHHLIRKVQEVRAMTNWFHATTVVVSEAMDVGH